MSQVDYADVQGLVRFGYGHMTSASYALVRVKNAAAAKAWFRSAPVTTAVAQKPPPKTALQDRVHGAWPQSAWRSGRQSLPVFRMSFAEVWDKKAARDNWVTLEKTRHQIGIGAATDASLIAVVMFFAEQDQLDSFIQRTRDQNWSDAFEEIDFAWHQQSRRRRTVWVCRWH